MRPADLPLVEMHPAGKPEWDDLRKAAYKAIAWDPVQQPYFYAQMHPKI